MKGSRILISCRLINKYISILLPAVFDHLHYLSHERMVKVHRPASCIYFFIYFCHSIPACCTFFLILENDIQIQITLTKCNQHCIRAIGMCDCVRKQQSAMRNDCFVLLLSLFYGFSFIIFFHLPNFVRFVFVF